MALHVCPVAGEDPWPFIIHIPRSRGTTSTAMMQSWRQIAAGLLFLKQLCKFLKKWHPFVCFHERLRVWVSWRAERDEGYETEIQRMPFAESLGMVTLEPLFFDDE
ncbi:hypothetical protein CEXT_469751 [Caerostris extrusa]|uniref:Uncharacterized protein n=1 Tax=Caerostris extrusa TaxID=172846 RepID=A0AAV4TKF3_CAEEX|nr:hypothetical protein CEXT_469751 [Caerostris extrusa]